ncbi:MAG: DUF1624 domain-containing protein [Oscillospiraceae bacterium]|nr:DUF1624 domain-containing protein [Oscillospiraceae bacterium]
MKSFAHRQKTGIRYHLLDEIRGFAIICMVFFHGFYLLGYVFNLSAGQTLFDFFNPAQPFFAGAFIFISGICCRFSHSNAKRGGILLAVSLALTAATTGLSELDIGVDEIILFGILHFLATAMLLFALLRRLFDKIPPLTQIPLFIFLFLLFWNVQSGRLGIGLFSVQLPNIVTDSVFLYPLGLHSALFFSADYFPVFPWLFLFLCGSAFGIYANRGKFPRFAAASHSRPLQFVGRNSLVIYLFHQPVLYLIILGIQTMLGKK